ncbi:MAG: hypothetical protein Q7U85_04470, partial [Rhodocyclaceae bacterium]|nr:hypothetical protein [Rhodocyclaceae bacterium]
MASATNSPSVKPSGPVAAPSLRQRIVLAGTLLLLVIVLAQALAAWLTLEQMEEDLIDQILDQQIEYSIALSRSSKEFAAPNTPDMQLYRIGPGDSAAEVPARLAALPIGNHEILDGGREIHIAVRQDDGYRFILAYDVEARETRLRILGFGMLASAIVLSVVFLVVILLLSKRLTAHLDQLARQVEYGTSDERFALPGMDR